MNNVMRVFRLSHQYLKYCPSRQKSILALGVIEFALLELYANVVSPLVISMLYRALDTGELTMVYSRGAICTVIIITFCVLCYTNDVYVDLNCFRINESILTRNFINLYELPYDQVKAQYDDSQIQARLDEGAGSADSVFIFIFLIAANIVSIGILLVMSGTISWLLLVITAISTVLGILLAKVETRGSEKYEPARQEAMGKSNGSLSAAIHGILTSNMNDLEEKVYVRYEEQRKHEWRVGWKQERLSLLTNAISGIFTDSLRGVLGLGMYPYYNQQKLSSANVASSFSIYDKLCSVVKGFSGPFGAISSALVKLDRMDQLMHKDQEKYCEKDEGAFIRVHDVCYAFGERKVLNHVDLTIRAGEKVAIIGHNGSGKSTLLRVMEGLCHPQQGYAVVGNVVSGSMNIRTRRELMTCIPANAYLYGGSIKDNVLMNADEGEAGMYLSVVEATHIAEVKCTQVSELSGGQAQRVNIARGIIHRAPILIADEPTAGLPTALGEAILQQLLADFGTCVVATHQMENLAMFTRVIKIEGGCIVSDRLI